MEQNSAAEQNNIDKERGTSMNLLLLIGIILLILWALGLFAFSLGGLIHIALVIAVILIIIWLLKKVFRLF